MADIANKYPDNVTGKYYVDNQCIDCDLCRETAPNNFKRNDDGGFSFVCKQPGTPGGGGPVQGGPGRLPGRSHRRQRLKEPGPPPVCLRTGVPGAVSIRRRRLTSPQI